MRRARAWEALQVSASPKVERRSRVQRIWAEARALARPYTAPVGKVNEKRSIAANRKARHEYEILEELECGLVLTGTETKSLRQGRASIAEAWCAIERGEMWLRGAHIPEYSHGTAFNHLPTRERKLLAHRHEIARWEKQVRERGITIVPLELYFQKARVKLHVALCRGKKLHDKRQSERERLDKREAERSMRRARD